MVVLVAGLALAATACGSSDGRQLMVADDTSGSGATATRVWAVEPGEALADSALVARDATQPLGISTIQPDGLSWYNQLGRSWSGKALLAYQTDARSLVTAGTPGARATTLASSDGPLQAVVLRRGVAIVNQDGCSLATDVARATKIGTGSCQISEDERWVVSWPATPGDLTIRDLRSDRVRVVRGIRTVTAATLGRDTRVLAVEEVDGGVRGRVIDATSGATVGDGTKVYDAMQVLPATEGATGFAAVAQSGTTVALLWVATDGTTTPVDTGLAMVPVSVDSGITYLRLDADETQDSVRRWTPDGATGDRTVLLTGKVGAGVATPGHLVATRETDTGVQFFRTATSGALEQVLTLRTDTSQPVTVNQMEIHDGVALLEVGGAQDTSFVRIDLTGDGSDAPVRNWPYLLLESVDTDGTALLTGTRGSDVNFEELLVVGAHDDTYHVRGRADATGTNLIHEGIIYYTDQPQSGDVTVRSVRATGDRDAKVLYRRHQIAGATWPENGGATQSLLVSRALLSQQQQSRQQQSQQQSQGQGGQ